MAKAYLIDFSNQFHHGIQRTSMTERAVINARLLVDVPSFDDPWKVLVRDAYGRIGLTIFQQDIVERLMRFDKVVLLNQRIFISRNHHIFDILYFAENTREITIYSLNGQLVRRTTQESLSDVWLHLPKGVYIVNGNIRIK